MLFACVGVQYVCIFSKIKSDVVWCLNVFEERIVSAGLVSTEQLTHSQLNNTHPKRQSWS